MIAQLMLFFHISQKTSLNRKNENANKIILGEKKLSNSFIDLQWFAAEDEGRTEEPTDYKISEARKKGRIAKSGDLNSSVVIFFPTLVLFFLGGFIFKSCMELISFFYERSTREELFNGRWFAVFINYFLWLVLPITVSAMLAGIISNVAQNRGFIFSSEPIKPNFNKIVPNFARFFKRAFFSIESLFNLGKSIFKVVVISIIGYSIIAMSIPKMVSLLQVNFALAISFIAIEAIKILFFSCLFLIVFSIPDYFFQKKQFMESLKMSKQELKEEYKMLEGDPVIRARVKKQMQEILSKRTVQSVKEADVIITNPTHFAVAIKWERHTMEAPMVTAKGEGNVARRIKRIAKDSNVPIVENKPLARSLYATVAVGQMIPQTYFNAIAVILSKIYSMDEQKMKEMTGGVI